VEFDCLPRAVKTHRPYDVRALGKNRSIYVVRHPGDVAVSYFEYRGAQGDHEMTKSALKAFVRDPEYGVPAWCEHVRSWRSQADVIVRYEQLKEDAAESIRRVLEQLGLNRVRNEIIEKAVSRSSFRKLKKIEEREDEVLPNEFDQSYKFMRKGRTGEWRERLDLEDVQFMKQITQKSGLDGLYSINPREHEKPDN
jgi:hypothetical protein